MVDRLAAGVWAPALLNLLSRIVLYRIVLLWKIKTIPAESEMVANFGQTWVAHRPPNKSKVTVQIQMQGSSG